LKLTKFGALPLISKLDDRESVVPLYILNIHILQDIEKARRK